MISFSTCWNSTRHTSGDATLREIKTKLGFDMVELDHGVRPVLMSGIQKIFDAGEIRFSSLDNFCPVPPETPGAASNGQQFSASSAGQREAAIEETFRTIDFAGRLNAGFVILHLGKVNMRPITDPLIAMAKTGKYLSREYVRTKIEAVQERERIAPEYLQRVKDCLVRIVEYAAKKDIRVGIENRRDYEEIPTERELAALLKEIDSPHLGYWHDFGHAQIKENLGFIDHAEWLRAMGSRAFGCHVQDCIWPARDRQPPFTGSVDFEKLVPLLPTNCLFVWEMNPNKSADGIRQSVQAWKERFGE